MPVPVSPPSAEHSDPTEHSPSNRQFVEEAPSRTTRSQAMVQGGITSHSGVSPQQDILGQMGLIGGVAYLREYHESNINEGPEYQAEIPDYDPVGWLEKDALEEKKEERQSVCLWLPPADDRNLVDEEIWEYCLMARNEHDYNVEQSLCLLLGNDYDAEKAMDEMNEYRPVSEEWTAVDETSFEQAFLFNGKNFRRIKQMLPDKTMANLVEHYYRWKKKRLRGGSLAETEYQKRRANREELDEAYTSVVEDAPKLESCHCCRHPSSQLQDTTNGRLCGTCFLYWRRTGKFRIMGGKGDGRNEEQSGKEEEICQIGCPPVPPVDMALNVAEFVESAPTSRTTSQNVDALATQRRATLRKLENAITQLRTEAYQNRSVMASDQGGRGSMAHLRVDQRHHKYNINQEWSSYETVLVQQALQKYGKDYAAIASVMGNKSEKQVRNYCEKYEQKIKAEEKSTEELEKGKGKEN